jgi:transcriptional regulator GlxA family with amidase domain
MNRKDAIISTVGALTAAALPLETRSQQLQLRPPSKGPVLVAFVVGPGANVIDLAGAWEVFQDVMVADRDAAFAMGLVSDTIHPIEATGGLTLMPKYTFDTLPAQPNVIFMGAQGEHSNKKIEWIRKASAKADLTMSVCTGAFLLAKTGLLDGLTATTHHDFYDQFAAKFPKVRLVRGPRYVEHERIATAGGLTSGIELALRVVQRYYGDETVKNTAYYMEYSRSAHRPIS